MRVDMTLSDESVPADSNDGHALPRSRGWLSPILLLSGVSLALFRGLYALDFYLLAAPQTLVQDSLIGLYLDFDSEKLTYTLSALAGVVADVLGIVIFLVSIVVQ